MQSISLFHGCESELWREKRKGREEIKEEKKRLEFVKENFMREKREKNEKSRMGKLNWIKAQMFSFLKVKLKKKKISIYIIENLLLILWGYNSKFRQTTCSSHFSSQSSKENLCLFCIFLLFYPPYQTQIIFILSTTNSLAPSKKKKKEGIGPINKKKKNLQVNILKKYTKFSNILEKIYKRPTQIYFELIKSYSLFFSILAS